MQENDLSANVIFCTLFTLNSWGQTSAQNANKKKGGFDGSERSVGGLFCLHDALAYSCGPLEIQVEIMN